LGPLRASNGLVKCVREFRGEDRGEKSMTQCSGNEGAKSREQRNHDKRFNCRVHVHIAQVSPAACYGALQVRAVCPNSF